MPMSCVVNMSPRLDEALRIAQCEEPSAVQARVPKAPVEALDVAVLDRLPGRMN